MQLIIPKIAVGTASNIKMSLSRCCAKGCIAEPALAQNLETDCCLIWVTVGFVLCKTPARGFEKAENISWRRRALPCSTNEPVNGLEAFPIHKEAHPSCPIQAVILCGLVHSCYTEPFSPQLFQRSKAHNNRAIAFVTCSTGICQCCFWLPFLCCSNSLVLR